MSELATRDGGKLLTNDEAAKLASSLLKLQGMVGAALDKETFDTIMARSLHWIERDGLTVDDVGEACREMMRPGTLAGCIFASNVLSLYTATVDTILTAKRAKAARQKAIDETLRRRAEAEADKKTQPRAVSITSMLNDLGDSWGQRGNN